MKTIDMRNTLAAVAVCLLLVAAVPAGAATYHVFGKVYGADPLPPEVSLPDELLPAGITAGQLVGGEGVAPSAPVAFVRVSVVNDANGAVLGEDLARTGAYYVSFTSTAASLEVRFLISDASNGSVLGDLGPRTITSGNNQVYPLISAAPRTAGVPHPVANGFYAFTRVGLIEAMNIEQGATSPNRGLASFPGKPARWQNAPFGGTLHVFGAVGRSFYPLAGAGIYCYQIEVTPDGGAPFLIDDPLEKGRYVVKEVGGTVQVTSSMVEVGPKHRSWGDCYEFTPLSEADPSGGTVFWSFPDLLARWGTGGLQDQHSLRVIVRNRATGAIQSVSGQPLVLHVDNRPVQLSFDAVEERTVSASDPSSVISTKDLLANACDIVSLLNAQKRLYMEVTAHHPGGFLASYSLTGRSNDPSDPVMVWASGTYPGSGSYSGVSHHGVQKEASDFPGTCAYAFHLHAWGRATNGYGRLFHPWKETMYYVQVP